MNKQYFNPEKDGFYGVYYPSPTSSRKALPHVCKAETLIYEHGTHFVFPESMLKTMIPVGSGLLVRLMFKAGREYSKACRQTRIDIDGKLSRSILDW